jgi:hypothetical protein
MDILTGAMMYEVGVEGDYFHPHPYDRDQCRKRGCVPFADLTKRARLDANEAPHVMRIINSVDNNFGAMLLRLIQKADLPNRQLLATVYPDYVRAYELAMRREGGLDDTPMPLQTTCRHCNEVIRKEPAQTLGMDVWFHVTGDGGRTYCSYRPDSPKAEPLQVPHG